MRRKEGESFPVCFFSSFLDRDFFWGGSKELPFLEVARNARFQKTFFSLLRTQVQNGNRNRERERQKIKKAELELHSVTCLEEEEEGGALIGNQICRRSNGKKT